VRRGIHTRQKLQYLSLADSQNRATPRELISDYKARNRGLGWPDDERKVRDRRFVDRRWFQSIKLDRAVKLEVVHPIIESQSLSPPL
jgi:hypothetical protein